MENVYVDPSENRINSRLKKSLSFEPKLLPGLEERTGADMLICAPNLPPPTSSILLKMNIESGAVLVQIKYGLDLIASIIDGRYKASQAKMLATGAQRDQIVLLFIAGVVMESNQNGNLIIGGEPVTKLIIDKKIVDEYMPQAKNFSWLALQKQINKWSIRGGTFHHLQLEHKLTDWINAITETMNVDAKKEFLPARQELFEIKDWRNTLVSLPRIGEKKANQIFSKYGNWPSFYDALISGNLADIEGIGKGTIETIKKYLGAINENF